MFKRLAARFIKDSDRTDLPRVRLAYGQLANVLAVGANAVLFLLKLLAGLAAGSVAIIADGLNNLSDAASNVVALIGFKLSVKPADKEHPYGHGRYEYLAGLIVAVLVIVAGVELFRSGLDRVMSPVEPVFSPLMAAALTFSVLVKLWMMAFNRSAGRAISSETLMATAADSRNDAIATSMVLAGMVIGSALRVDLDGWLAMGVAVFIAVSGVGLVRDTLDPLLGARPDGAVVEDIRQRVLAFPGVLGTHDLLLHDYGPGRLYASAHVEMSADGDVLAMQRSLEKLSRELLESEGIHMVFQLDPISSADNEENRLRRYLTDHMSVIDSRVAVHDPRITHDGGRVRISFDCFVPGDVNIPDAELHRILTGIVRIDYPDADLHITVDRDYMAPQG